jgi:hypothetical protein
LERSKGAAVQPAAPSKEPAALSKAHAEILKDEAVQFPLWAWFQLLPMTIFTCGYGILKAFYFTQCRTMSGHERGGSHGGSAGPPFWLWYWTPVPILCGFMYATAIILKRRSKAKSDVVEYTPLENDLTWDDATLKKFPTVALLAGVAAGLLGIGGGMVIGPLFMEIGMEPQVRP